MTSSKEALDYVTSNVFTGGNSILKEEAEVCKNIILQDLDRLERLEKENQELIEALKTTMNDQIYYRYEELKKELSIMAERERYFIEIINEYNNRESMTIKPIRLEVNSADLFKQNIELTKAIHKAIELLSVDGKGTKQEVKKLLSEVLENVD